MSVDHGADYSQDYCYNPPGLDKWLLLGFVGHRLSLRQLRGSADRHMVKPSLKRLAHAGAMPLAKTGMELPPPDRRLAYQVPDAAAMIGVSRSTMWSLIAEQRIPACKVGAATLIRHADLVAFLDALPVWQPPHERKGPQRPAN